MTRGRPTFLLLLFAPAVVLAAVLAAQAADTTVAASTPVAALGRIEPEHGILVVSLASLPEAVNGSLVTKLFVKAGDDVVAGQILAECDSVNLQKAEVELARAEVELASRNADKAASEEQDVCARAAVAGRTSVRRSHLLKKGVTSDEEADVAAGDAKSLSGSCAAAGFASRAALAAVDVARAKVTAYQASLDRAYVRAPSDGRILQVLTWPGELVALNGVVEMANVKRMYAIAEVWETDIGRVRVGQKASVTSTALARPLSGVVEHIRLKVRKQDTTGTDPASRKDARIVEVEVLLDQPEAVASLSNLQVEVVIQP